MDQKIAPEKMIRKLIPLSADMLREINFLRRDWPGRVPSEGETIRLLLLEALEARRG